jgi:hypothetical protein
MTGQTMRKYIAVALIAAALTAGQAVAAENDALGDQDKQGKSDDSSATDETLEILLGLAAVGLIAWGLTEHGQHERPASA